MKTYLLKPFFRVGKSMLPFFPPYLYTGALSHFCSVCRFCSPNVMLLFIPNLPVFSTTNHRLALFVFRTTNCLFLIQALNLLATLSSLAHCLSRRLPLVIYGMQNCKGREK